MSTFNIVMLTLIIYSAFATIVIELSKENEDVIAVFGFGVVGCWLILISKIIGKINNLFKYHIGKRSIFENANTGEQYKCHTKNANDIIHWNSEYKLVQRYAKKSLWKDIPDFNEEFIKSLKRNCDHCKIEKECPTSNPFCKHDMYGTVIEFDRFEEK